MIDEKLLALEKAVMAVAIEMPEIAEEGERLMDAAVRAYGLDPEALKRAADEQRAELLSLRTYRTKTGRLLTDADIEAFADEAERGYEVHNLTPRGARSG